MGITSNLSEKRTVLDPRRIAGFKRSPKSTTKLPMQRWLRPSSQPSRALRALARVHRIAHSKNSRISVEADSNPPCILRLPPSDLQGERDVYSDLSL